MSPGETCCVGQLVLGLQQLLQGPSASLVSFTLQAMVEHAFCT